jgi:hypothetical protein
MYSYTISANCATSTSANCATSTSTNVPTYAISDGTTANTTHPLGRY